MVNFIYFLFNKFLRVKILTKVIWSFIKLSKRQERKFDNINEEYLRESHDHNVTNCLNLMIHIFA